MQDFEKVGDLLVPRGAYAGTIIRGGYFDDDGVWHRGKEIVDHFAVKNMAVAQGLNSILGVQFHGDTQITNWYLGVFEGNYTPVDNVTAATIASASTECTAYADGTRPAYVPAAPTNKIITNAASRASFIFNDTKVIYGAFLISDNTKAGVAGTLFSAARFPNAKSVGNLDELLLTYSFTLSSS